MTLYPPTGLLDVLELEVCWESDLQVQVGDLVVPIHRSVLIGRRSQFLTDLFGSEFSGSGEPIPVNPPHPELFLRALHSITTRARPELTENEFVGFVRTAAFLQSEELQARLCEASLANWRSLTRVRTFKNPAVPPHFLEMMLLMAREREVMTASEALEVLAAWCSDDISGGTHVLEKLVAVQELDAAELTRLQQLNPRFVELLSSVNVSDHEKGLGQLHLKHSSS
eukprot:TRINITY_DN38179_c0_g1_i1.p1 TRINITY_DN38179_c0_g1~~TRINITY_DN38179_c0_g1_i1.p1  ORF type:complete len:226 (-),score=50.62 TRINITY_DN38179_c0_g1_i1:2-679(-)